MAIEPLTEPIVVSEPTPEAPPAEPVRSRRSLLGTGLAGLAGLVLGSLGLPRPAEAAAGGSLIMGSSNSAGTSNTSLTTDSTGTALLVTQTGAGTALRGSALAVNGIAGFFTSANGSGVSGVTANKDKYAVYGGNDATATGSGAAVRAAGEQNNGLVATTASASAYAIKATNTNTGTGPSAGPGIRVLAGNGTDADIDGLTTYPAAGEFCGVNGVVAVAVAGHGVYATSTSGSGLRGWSTSGSGVYGASDSGDGVDGNSTSATGVYGNSTSGNGVYGEGGANGVYGDSASGNGVYGATTSGYAVYSEGNAHVNGNLSVVDTLTKGGGSFKIDHPLDPANKFLYHSFVESPDMKNVYDGVVTLDAKGEATVTLPDWFEALNRDFRYQLTAMGSSAPDLYVKSKVKANAFSIAGGAPSQEVSWQLTGIRKDAWADAHRIPVEEEKPAAERGLYLHPTENGQPAAKGIDAVRNAAMKPHPSK
ncbi:MAG: hypothetical protein ABSA21_12980 [Candidatus Limnocylindrales bacterium]